MKLLIADDHTLFRDTLVQYVSRAEPEAQIYVTKDLGEARDALAQGLRPDLVLLDLRMPGMNGLEGFREIRETYPDVPVGLMSGMAGPQDVRRAMEMGAIGYFPKTLSGKALLKAIQLVLTGERFLPIDRETNEVLSSYYGDSTRRGAGYAPLNGRVSAHAPDGDIRLTSREREVLIHLVQGISNKDIADALNLQIVTVKLHVRGICRKLGVKNRTQAALKAKELGIADAG